MDIRQRLEEKEETLSPYALKSRLSRGRMVEEEPCPMRTCFQRDRDRIIHCKSFRRLKHKTQVFIAPSGDHFVTRLTHTLEVSQIARSIARSLNLNEDLAEAISLGHDLGHTPFGHVGEEVLNELSPSGFRHREQSLRVVDVLENLNLTFEVREGILKHSKGRKKVLEWPNDISTLEGEICKLSDVIAYLNHDTDDAIRAGIIAPSDLPSEVIRILGASRSQRINAFVKDVVFSSSDGKLNMSPSVLKAANILHEFLFQKVYLVSANCTEAHKSRDILRFLYQYFCSHPENLPPGYSGGRGVVDFIAGMTDQYAISQAKDIS
jgi:dGTPase